MTISSTLSAKFLLSEVVPGRADFFLDSCPFHGYCFMCQHSYLASWPDVLPSFPEFFYADFSSTFRLRSPNLQCLLMADGDFPICLFF